MVIRFGSDQRDDVKEIITHPNFFKSIETLQDNIVRNWKIHSFLYCRTFFQALLMLETEIYDGDLPCIIKSKDVHRCHVFSWGTSKFSENSMKVDNVEVLSKGECYTQHLISGKKHEKYVHRGNNNICVGNANRFELDIVSSCDLAKINVEILLKTCCRISADLLWRVIRKTLLCQQFLRDFWPGRQKSISILICSQTSLNLQIGLNKPSTKSIWTQFKVITRLG